MRVLLTGGTGFIGQHLARRLVEDGHELVALIRSPSKRRLLPRERTELLKGDLSVFKDSAIELPACDLIVHLAGAVAAPTAADYERANVTAVADLLACVQRQSWRPRRLLFASSQAAVGPSVRDQPHTESAPLRPVEIYGETKRDAEALVAQSEYPTTSFRPCIVQGDGDTATLTIFKAASRGIGVRAAGQPQQLSIVDVADVVSAIVAMAHDERPGHRAYFVSHPDLVTIEDWWHALGLAFNRRVRVVKLPAFGFRLASAVATAVTRVTGGRNQLDRKQVDQILAPSFACSSAALSEELGWTANVDLVTSTRRAVEGYRARGWV